jgi:hypothetical protein
MTVRNILRFDDLSTAAFPCESVTELAYHIT